MRDAGFDIRRIGRLNFTRPIRGLKIANALLSGEKRKRLQEPDILRFIQLLEGLSPLQETQPPGDSINTILPLARERGLSACDVSYPELAIRRRTSLATIDAKLMGAATSAGVKIFAA